MAERAKPEDKPIFWIPVPPDASQKSAPASHDRFSGLSGQMELDMKVVSDYLYVGGGVFRLDDNEQAYYAFARRNGQLTVPGMGIKGAVRSIVEAISRSCIKVVAGPTRERGEIIKPDERPWVGKHGKYEKRANCLSGKTLCPACRLFGTTGYRGRVHFSDAIPVGRVESTTIRIGDLWPPRLAEGRKFYETKAFQSPDDQAAMSHRFIEIVPKTSRFSLTLLFENATAAEMGLIVRALGFDLSRRAPDKIIRVFPVKIGGAKPRCLGAVEMAPRQVRLVSEGAGIFASLSPGTMSSPAQDYLKNWLRDESLLDSEAWKDFSRKARPQPDTEKCPKEVY